MVVYSLWKREVAGSNPASQTKCSISIVVSASDFNSLMHILEIGFVEFANSFLSEDKGSVPL